MSYRFTGQISIEVFDLGEADFNDLKDRIEEAAAGHKATVTADGRRQYQDDEAKGEQQ